MVTLKSAAPSTLATEPVQIKGITALSYEICISTFRSLGLLRWIKPVGLGTSSTLLQYFDNNDVVVRIIKKGKCIHLYND